MTLQLFAIEGLPEIRPGDDLAGLLTQHADMRQDDVVIVAQKVVSKSEGRLVDLRGVAPSPRADELAARLGADARFVQVVLDESVSVLRDQRVLIVETRQGFVCANGGVDRSNVPGEDTVSVLPLDCDASAAVLRNRIRERTGLDVGVVVSDTFGRAWRLGLCNVALGVAGIAAVRDQRGEPDDTGRPLEATVVAVADELAAAAELLMGKTRRIPAVVVRGLPRDGDPGGRGVELIRPPALDLFR